MSILSKTSFTDRTDLPATERSFGNPWHAESAPWRHDGQLAYWKKQLAGAPAVLNLPTDRPRPPVYSYQGASRELTLNQELSRRLQELSLREGVTLFVSLLAAFKVLLNRYTRQDDIVVGVPVPVPSRQENGAVNNTGSNLLPLRIDLSGNPTFREFLQRVQQAASDGFAHRDLPFEELVDELQLDMTPSHSALFQVLFGLRNASDMPLEGACEPAVGAARGKVTTEHDLMLWLVERERHLQATLHYNADLFNSETAARLLAHFQVLLEGIVADPERRLGELPLLTETERHKLLTEWNRTEAAFPSDRCVHELFEVQVERTPEAVAVIVQKEQLTYRQLNARANQVAGYLRQEGIGPESLVGLALEPSLEMVVGLLGILKAGGAYVPLDPNYPKERLAFLMQDSRIPVLLTQERLVGELPAHQARVVRLDADWKLISRHSATNPACAVSAENLAYVIYTSGSTGKPKGIMVPHRGLVNYLTWCVKAYSVEDGAGAPVHSSISFDLTVTCLFAPLMVGRAVELFSPSGDVGLLREAFRTKRNYSLVKITPAHLELLAKQILPEEAAGRTRAFIIGGENLTARQIAFWQERAPDTALINEYGPTETVVGCCVYRVLPGKPRSGSIPIGRPIANTQLYVLDAHLQPVPVGVPGELYIGGAGLARGYLNRPELTAERFIPHPFSNEPTARLYKTGDLVRWLPDENLEFLGRLDEQLKLRGFRIEPGEIEAALAQHPQVHEAVVILREDRPGTKRLVGYVVLREESGPTPSDLRGFLAQKLPAYMVPSAIVILDRLPLTPNSKVDRRALPVPEDDRRERTHAYLAPRTPVEESLARIWKELLEVSSVGIHDDFFELGGDSLLAVELFARIQKAFGLELPVSTLFQGATIERLAHQLTRPAPERGRRALVEIKPGGTKPPLFLVHALGGELITYSQLARCLDPDQPVYGFQQSASGVEVPASVEAMGAAYVEELLSVQSQEPFLLVGHSFGAILALEMAQQLTAKGHHVALLALIDEGVPDLDGKASWNASRIWGVVQDFPHWLRYDFLRRTPSHHYARFLRFLRRAKRKVAKLLGRLPEKSREEEIADLFAVFALPERIRAFSAANFQVFFKYRPQRYPGRITVFRARSQLLLGPHEPDLGWGKIAAGGVTVRVIPGTHESILKEPHVKVFARELEALLSRL